MAGILVALGGNALHRAGGRGSWEEARTQMHQAVAVLAEVAASGDTLVLSHGNGPQVGALLRQNELAAREIAPRPMDVLGAETQGQIGYLIQTELTPALARRGVKRSVITVISRTEVSADDPAFRNPSKPVGRYYPEDEARVLRKQYGWSMQYDGARGGWRRIVPSPRPVRWIEGAAVRSLLESNMGSSWIPVVAGGGGIPVVRRPDGTYEGVEAVIDKDLAASLVAQELGIHTLAIVTDVPGAAVSFGKRGERWLGQVSRRELAEFQRRGEFAHGSMGPKVTAGLEFLDGGGRRFVIADIPSLARALRGEAGTRVEA
ncbi:MAG TPA: carbamate kinase [Thermoplasmata archaeon]|nr:carbamate kinase [Thermoplasmata archaeon]